MEGDKDPSLSSLIWLRGTRSHFACEYSSLLRCFSNIWSSRLGPFLGGRSAESLFSEWPLEHEHLQYTDRGMRCAGFFTVSSENGPEPCLVSHTDLMPTRANVIAKTRLTKLRNQVLTVSLLWVLKRQQLPFGFPLSPQRRRCLSSSQISELYRRPYTVIANATILSITI